MGLIHNISTVARYEAKTLRRSWFFRLFSIGALVIFTFMNIGVFSPIGEEDWQVVSNPASVPLINLYLLNIGQAIVVIFLASDFLRRDKKVDTNEVLYTRSMSNFEYVMGKTAGILRLFLSLNIVILMIGLLMNIISTTMTVDLTSYLWYLLIISVPTIVFSLGLAFMLMSLLKNQAITFLILLGIAALNMFWLNYRFGFIFDYMAFGLPVFKSGMIGFDNIALILNQRLFYLFLGLSLVLATVLLFKRLPQSKGHTIASACFMLIFLAGAVVCGFNTWSSFRKDINERSMVIDSNRQFENSIFVSLTDAEIDFRHDGSTFSSTATLKFRNSNRESLDRYLFSLNPYLKVNSVASSGNNLNYTKTNHIIEIEPTKPLLPGESDSITISYSGSVDESFCFPGYTDKFTDNPYRVAMVNVNKKQAFLSDDYVLLTPEAHWYPVPGLNYYPSNPARIKIDFTRYTLRVKPGNGLVPVAQGKMKKEGDYFVFTPESPLTGITLAIGNYRSDTLKVDSVSYITWYYPGHDYYKKDLAELKDTLNLLVSGIMRELETSFSTKYPFKTLGLLEVPVQFYSYPRMSTQTRAELQPSLVLLPEKLSMLDNAGFLKRFTRQKKRMERNNQVITDKELQVRLFNDFIRNTFISGENFRYRNGTMINEPVRYRLGPSFYFFRNNFFSAEYPVINAVFEAHLQKQVSPQSGLRQMSGALSENDRANLILREASFRDVLAMNPGGDTIRTVLTVKGDYLFNLLRSKAGIEGFREWFPGYIDQNAFKSVDIITLNNDIKDKFGFEFYPYLSDWFTRKEQPGFIFTGLQANEVVVGDRVRYLVTFTAANPEQVTGIFNISFRTGGEGGPNLITGSFQGGPRGGNYTISMQGRGMEASDISRIILLGPGEAKKIRIITDTQPREMLINTLFAKNIPGEITLPIDEVVKSGNRQDTHEGEETLAALPPYAYPGELIVDNEDPGFDAGNTVVQPPLKKILGIKNRRGTSYEQINMFWAPEFWQPVVLSSYYGKYIRSSVYTRAAKGDKSVVWETGLDDPGFYDVWCYIGKTGDRMVVRSGGPGGAAPPPPPGAESGGENIFKDMHYKIYHDEGVEEITVDFENAGAGWNMLGRYYISSDTAKVELTNQSSGRMVLGDAVKWVKAD